MSYFYFSSGEEFLIIMMHYLREILDYHQKFLKMTFSHFIFVCIWLTDDMMSDSDHRHNVNASNHTEPHAGYTRGISVEQTSLNGQ